jgi:nitroreductase/NAD-dependent dihydropyrimidine dehydrogenase PreA subunit
MITIDPSRCNLCGICVPICVRRVLRLGEKSVEVTDPLMCLACGHCKAVCPTDAPRLKKGNEDFALVPHREEFPQPAPFLRFLRFRRSLRKYKAIPVEKEKLDWVIEAGRYAATGGNRQACEYKIIQGRKNLDRVCQLAIAALLKEGQKIRKTIERYRNQQKPLPEKYMARQYFPAVWERIAEAWEKGQDQLLHHAPALFVIHLKPGTAVTPEGDAAIASAQMTLMAETLGLGTCYIAMLVWAIDRSGKLRNFLKIPEGDQVHLAFTVGYPDVEYLRLPARKPAKVGWIGESPS